MGGKTELIFVEGGSTDNTYDVIEKTMADYPASAVQTPAANR